MSATVPAAALAADPFFGAAFADPSIGAAFADPSIEAAFADPSIGAAFADPSIGAAFADPSIGAAFAAVEGLGLGAGLIIAIGAQNAYVLRQGLRRQHVFAVASVCFLIDCALIALGAGGFASLLRAVPSLPSLAAWGGAAFLAAYSLRAFAAALRPQALKAADGAAGASPKAALATALALSLLNPHVYLDTVVLLGGVAARYAGEERLAFALGAMLASALWFYGLGYGARRLAPLFASERAWRLLDGFVGCVMAALAVSLVFGQLR